jgi:hypothetical protein
MLAKLKLSLTIAALGGLTLIYGCSLPQGAPMVLKQNDYSLYNLPSINVDRPNDEESFWSDFATNAQKGDHDAISIRMSRLSSRIVRFERTQNRLPVSIDMAIFVDPPGQNSKLRMQPLFASQPALRGVEGIEIITATKAAPIVASLKDELKVFVPSGD